MEAPQEKSSRKWVPIVRPPLPATTYIHTRGLYLQRHNSPLSALSVPLPSSLYFLKLFFTDFAIAVVPVFPLLPISTQQPPLLLESLHHCSCSLVVHIGALAAPFPTLYFTSPRLFCNYTFVLLNPLTSSPVPPHPLPFMQWSKPSLYLWFCLCSSCLLNLFYRLNCW